MNLRASFFFVPLTLVSLASLSTPALAATLKVGPNESYAAPCAAIAAAMPGDTIEIDASGNYDGDVCAFTKSGLTLRGVGGLAKIDAAGKSAQGKAIWVIAGDDTTVENIEFSGAKVIDMNGAGIRQEGKNLTVRGCYFHDNEDGILAGDNADSEILIERSVFTDNGAGDGFSHNMYINHIKKLTLRYSYSARAKVGHLIKSRAAETHVLYNRLSSEGSTTSYEINLPNGGLAFVIGNVVQQGVNSQNGAILDFGSEGPAPGSQLFAVNNTFVNNRANGTFIKVQGSVSNPTLARNNIFAGSGTLCDQASAVLDSNFSGGDPKFVDAANFDYHLMPGSPCENAGADPGMGAGQSLSPLYQYVHQADVEGRMSVGAIDIGAYEIGGATSGTGGASGAGGASGTGGASGSGGSASGAGGSASGAGGSTSGAGGNVNVDSEDEGGCSCRVGERPRPGMVGWLGLGLAALALYRRRRESC